MPEEKMPTHFLPAELAGSAELARQINIFSGESPVKSALDGMINFTLILNRQRQAVFVNQAFLRYLQENGIKEPLGLRFGNLSGCIHPGESAGGCGTTESCRYCGSAKALTAALEGGEAREECRILSRKAGDDLDLQVHAKPFNYLGEDFLLMSVGDISSEKRRHVLENLFFHDVLNTAGGLQGLMSLMDSADPAEAKSFVPLAVKSSDRLVEQLLSHKDLAAAENGDLHPGLSEFTAEEFLVELAGLFSAHDVSKGRHVRLSGDFMAIKLLTDRTLLSRVVGNMLKNALEAEADGSVVTLSCGKVQGGVFLAVHNPRCMPDEVRRQIFQRSFSTKGQGRGLGTYSMRLLTEKYLKGKISLTTGDKGTEFRVELPDKYQ